MIVAARSESVGPKTHRINSGKGTYISPIYEGFKQTARIYGFYKDIKPYLPETYLKKYTYKPHKRAFGYASQKLHEKKNESPPRRFKQKLDGWHCKQWNYNSDNNPCSSG